MKLKSKIQKALDNEDFETFEQYGGGSDGFWYDLTDGGYFKPEEVLADKADIGRVKEAIKTLRELEKIYTSLTPEF